LPCSCTIDIYNTYYGELPQTFDHPWYQRALDDKLYFSNFGFLRIENSFDDKNFYLGTTFFIRPFFKKEPSYQITDFEYVMQFSNKLLEIHKVKNFLDFDQRDHACLSILMMQARPDLIRDKLIVDAGSGGDAILSIVASRLGARKIIAFEHNSGRATESLGFLTLNDINNVDVVEKDFTDIKEIGAIGHVDAVIANINAVTFIPRTRPRYDSAHAYMAAIFKPSWYFVCGMRTRFSDLNDK